MPHPMCRNAMANVLVDHRTYFLKIKSKPLLDLREATDSDIMELLQQRRRRGRHVWFAADECAAC
jgi:hypothetical protein